MTNKEFDTQFDIFYNNIASNAAPSVNSYEKSVFLTQAQRDIIIELYNGRGVTGLSFESTEEARKYLSNLTKVFELDTVNTQTPIILPTSLWFSTYEECKFNDESKPCLIGTTMTIVPIKHDDLFKTLNNPFKGPSENRVIRVDLEGKIQLYSKYNISNYKMYYIENPKPIILEDLSQYNLSIEGLSFESESNVNPILHMAILDRAVKLAKTAYTM